MAMINAVVFEPLPDDPTSGRILWSTQAPAGAMALETRPWIEVDPYAPNYDATHKVVSGALAPIGD